MVNLRETIRLRHPSCGFILNVLARSPAGHKIFVMSEDKAFASSKDQNGAGDAMGFLVSNTACCGKKKCKTNVEISTGSIFHSA